MRLLMEAVMIIAIVSGMVFVSKISASENKAERTYGDEVDDDTIDGDNKP